MFPQKSGNPKLIGCFGIVFSLLGLLIIVVQWDQFKHMPVQPVPLQLSTLNEQINHTSTRWVRLEGGHWDCRSIKIKGAGQASETKALYIGEGTSVAYATFSGKMSCEELTRQPATGELSSINEKMLVSIKEENARVAQFPENTVVYDLCTYCGPSNSLAGIFVGCFLIPSGLVILLYARQEYQKKTIQIFGG